MLAYLRGTIQNKEVTGGPGDRLILDIAGVGFEINVSPRTLANLGAPGVEATIYTSLQIRETEWSIFGFATLEEKELFSLLQSVTGIGPKLALALVSSFSPDQLSQAIINEDQRLITQAPGVGSKVAQRIILELKSKVEDWSQRRLLCGAPAPQTNSLIEEEVRIILSGLGYTNSEINVVLTDIKNGGNLQDVETVVRQSLRLLGAATVA